MYSKIMFPVDLAHVEQLQKALGTAADLAKLYGAKIFFVGVTSYVPTKLGRNPDEYAAKLIHKLATCIFTTKRLKKKVADLQYSVVTADDFPKHGTHTSVLRPRLAQEQDVFKK